MVFFGQNSGLKYSVFPEFLVFGVWYRNHREIYNSFLSFIIALMLTRNSVDARNCYRITESAEKMDT